MGDNIGKHISKKFIGQYNPEIHLKLLQKEQSKKTAELAGDLIGSKIADRIKNFMKISR